MSRTAAEGKNISIVVLSDCFTKSRLITWRRIRYDGYWAPSLGATTHS